MLGTLWRGITLRCPHCGKPTLGRGLFDIHETCANCGVRFERKSGESSGASLIWVSLLPLIALCLYFAIELSYPGITLWISVGVPLGVLLVMGIGFYRNARGLWIAISYLTGGVYTDDAP